MLENMTPPPQKKEDTTRALNLCAPSFFRALYTRYSKKWVITTNMMGVKRFLTLNLILRLYNS